MRGLVINEVLRWICWEGGAPGRFGGKRRWFGFNQRFVTPKTLSTEPFEQTRKWHVGGAQQGSIVPIRVVVGALSASFEPFPPKSISSDAPIRGVKFMFLPGPRACSSPRRAAVKLQGFESFAETKRKMLITF